MGRVSHVQCCVSVCVALCSLPTPTTQHQLAGKASVRKMKSNEVKHSPFPYVRPGQQQETPSQGSATPTSQARTRRTKKQTVPKELQRALLVGGKTNRSRRGPSTYFYRHSFCTLSHSFCVPAQKYYIPFWSRAHVSVVRSLLHCCDCVCFTPPVLLDRAEDRLP